MSRVDELLDELEALQAQCDRQPERRPELADRMSETRRKLGAAILAEQEPPIWGTEQEAPDESQDEAA